MKDFKEEYQKDFEKTSNAWKPSVELIERTKKRMQEKAEMQLQGNPPQSAQQHNRKGIPSYRYGILATACFCVVIGLYITSSLKKDIVLEESSMSTTSSAVPRMNEGTQTFNVAGQMIAESEEEEYESVTVHEEGAEPEEIVPIDGATDIPKKFTIEVLEPNLEKDIQYYNRDMRVAYPWETSYPSNEAEPGSLPVVPVVTRTETEYTKVKKCNLDSQEKQLEYFYETYGTALLDYVTPRFKTRPMFTIDGELKYEWYVYEGSGEKELNYRLAQTQVIYDKEEDRITFLTPDITKELSEEMYYNIISADKAVEGLVKGNYVSGIPTQTEILQAQVRGISLEYSSDICVGYQIPVYCIFVDYSRKQRMEIGIADKGDSWEIYGKYLVPALEAELVSLR